MHNGAMSHLNAAIPTSATRDAGQRWLEANPPGATPATWIWADADVRLPDAWAAFRHRFALAAAPRSACATIAADTKYWLWVNGTLVVREGGLKRGPTPDDGYADRIDLAPWLRAGDNQLAILVWHLGHDGASHRDSGAGGLLVALDADGQRVVSSGAWKAQLHPAFDRDGERAASLVVQANVARADFANFKLGARGTSITLSEWSVRFDARRDLPAWTEGSGDDRTWPAAVELGRPPAAPWGRLAERPIPMWADGESRPYAAILGGSLPCVGPATIVGMLPANLPVLPSFTIDGEAGAELVVCIDRDYKTTTWVSAGGDQHGEVLAWGNGQQVIYQVPPGMRLIDIAWRPSEYASSEAGAFASSDPRLDRLWLKCARSVRLNMRDTFTDCPDRERAPWPGDAANSIDIAVCTLDPAALPLVAKTLSEFCAWRAADGELWGGVPTGRFRGTFREFPAQSLALVALGFPTYVMHSGDTALAQALWPAIQHYVLNLHTCDERGLVRHRGPWEIAWGAGVQCWYDWGQGIDALILDQGWYALALRTLGELADHLGLSDDAARFHEQHARLAQAIRRHLWDDARQAFCGAAENRDERGNALLVLAGVPDAAQAMALAGWMPTHDQASIYMERHVLEALCQLVPLDTVLARIRRRYAHEITSSTTTLSECFGDGQNHAWGGAPAIILARHLAGVRPLAPGWRRFAVRPAASTLERYHLRQATVAGTIEVSVENRSQQRRLAVTVPPGTTAEIHAPGLSPEPAAEPGLQELAPGIWLAEPGHYLLTGPI